MKRKFTFLLFAVALFFLSLQATSLRADTINELVVTGQVTTLIDGYPLVGHKVYIINDSLTLDGMLYYNEIYTDEYGFYYDTIYTTFSHGAIIVSTSDFNENILSASVHFRFMTEENDNIFINDFAIFMPVMTPHLQASFSHQQDTINNRFEFAFFDQTSNGEVLEWQWDFGDDNYSDIQNPVHVYAEPGFYNVSLTVVAIVDNRTETNTITKFVFIPVNVYFDMGGNCFADLFPIAEAMVYLYKKDSTGAVIPFDTNYVNEEGIYYFYHVVSGEYCIKVQPNKNSQYYGVMMPTYYGDELFWEDATFFMHDHKNYELDINLQRAMGMVSGGGKIAGIVQIEDLVIHNFLQSAQGVDVYLFDEEWSILSSHYTDENGEFVFNNVAFGTYYITPEIMGIPKQETRIDISEATPEYSSIVINGETGEITLDVIETSEYGQISVGDPFPNPASDHIKLRVDVEKPIRAEINLFDLQGRLLQTSTKQLNGNDVISVSTADMENGIYFLRMEFEHHFSQHKFIVSR